jgi:hypothetical protein
MRRLSPCCFRHRPERENQGYEDEMTFFSRRLIGQGEAHRKALHVRTGQDGGRHTRRRGEAEEGGAWLINS